MTHEELKKKERELERQAEAAFRQQCKLRERYVEEHEPLHAKRYQRMMIRLRVTVAHRKQMGDKERGMRKWQLGNEYTVTGIFTGYALLGNGDIRPCFYGNTTYSRLDEIVSIELTKEQPEGDCSKCRLYKDGLCYMAGGKDLGKSYATHKVKEGDIVCPKYEEILEGGLYEYGEASRHCPNVTVVKDLKGKKTYHVWSLKWNCYTEYSETDVWKFYTTEPKKQNT